MRSLLLVLVAALTVGACSMFERPAGDLTIDTWPIGDPLDCTQERSCDELVRVGLAGLAERNPGHAPAVATHLHSEGAVIDPATGKQLLMIRSGGCCHVLVVELADGTTRAIGVGYPGISREAVAIPWGP